MTSERLLSGAQGLLERDRELAAIDAGIAAAAADEGSFLVLEGRSGMGKSALLAEVRRRAAAAGLAACSAQGSELEGEFAFGVVRQLFEPVIGALSQEERARVFEGAGALAEPVLDIGGDAKGAGAFPALHGLYWLAANLAANRPLLLAVDDAHWADAPSLRWLAYLLNRLEGLPILVAIATRPPQSGPEREVLTSILTHHRVRILPVRPLGQDSVGALVRSTLAADPDPIFTAACLRATTGNPLWLRELLRELRADGVAPTRAAVGDLDRRAPDAIARRIQRDLRSLGDEAERLARALAVMGDGAELRLVARLADLDVDRAAEAADDLLAADLIASGRPPRFTHPLLRAAVYDRLPGGSRQKLHRLAAEILASEGSDPEAVAAHLLRCEAGRGPDTIEWLGRAAPLARRRGAPEAAVSYLTRALAEGCDSETRSSVLAELGRAELAAGTAAAVDHLREALIGVTDRRARAELLGDLGLAVLLQSDEPASRDILDEALRELQGSDTDLFTRLECFVTGLTPVDPSRVVSPEVYPRLRMLARGGTRNAELARVTLAMLLSWRDGNREEALGWVVGGFDWSHLLEGTLLRPIAVTWSMLALLGLDDLDGAVAWCKTVVGEAAAAGDVHDVVIGTVYKAYAEARMGLLADAEADATTAFELSQQHLPYWVPVTAAYLAEILFERGRPLAAYDAIERISVGPGIAGGVMEIHVRGVRGRLRWARGWRQQGVDDLRAMGRLCEVHRLRNPIICPWQAWLAVALGEDSIDEARQLAQENLSNARRSGIPRAIGVALRTLARLSPDGSIDLLRAAVAALEGSPGPLDLARALTDLGGALRRQGHRVESRKPLAEALEIAARCGAVPLMARAQAEALAAGARPRRPRLRGVDALTPSELRVARLAAEGRSNREIAQALFITANTVADHLGSSYSKLAITSRDQLSTALGTSNPSTDLGQPGTASDLRTV